MSDNEDPEGDASIIDHNISLDNLGDNLPILEDELGDSQESSLDDSEGNTLVSPSRTNFVTQVADEQEQITINIEKLRS